MIDVTSGAASGPPESTPSPRVGEARDAVPRVLMLKLTDSTVKVNPFHLDKSLKEFKPTNISQHRNGNYELEMGEDWTARKPLRAQSLQVKVGNRTLAVPISVSPHTSKNNCRGVVSCRDLSDITDDEILDGLREQGVVGAKKLAKTGQGKDKDTGTVMLTFSGTSLPDRVYVGWRSLRVRQFIPNPIRCFKCQSYGHMAASCKGEERCAKCGKPGHKSTTCSATTPKCAGCDGSHEAWDRSCPKRKSAQEALKEKEQKTRKRETAKTHTQPNKQTVSKDHQEAYPYRDALLGGASKSSKHTIPEINPTNTDMNCRIGDCMGLSLREFLVLLLRLLPLSEEARGTTVTSKAQTADQATQTTTNTHDASTNMCTTDITEQVNATTDDTPEQVSGKRVREESPPVSQPASSNHEKTPTTIHDNDASLTHYKRARVALTHLNTSSLKNTRDTAEPNASITDSDRAVTPRAIGPEQTEATNGATLSPPVLEEGTPAPVPPSLPPSKPQRTPRALLPSPGPRDSQPIENNTIPPPPPPHAGPPGRVGELVESINKRTSVTNTNKVNKIIENTANTLSSNTETGNPGGSMPPPPTSKVPPGFRPRDRGRAHSFSERPMRPHSREPDSYRRAHSRDRSCPVWDRGPVPQLSGTLTGGIPFQGPSQTR